MKILTIALAFLSITISPLIAKPDSQILPLNIAMYHDDIYILYIDKTNLTYLVMKKHKSRHKQRVESYKHACRVFPIVKKLKNCYGY